MIASEVKPAFGVLCDNGIQVTAIYSHNADRITPLFFMHFWADDDALKVARGMRAALDKDERIKALIGMKMG